MLDNGSSVSGKNILELGIIFEILWSQWPFLLYKQPKMECFYGILPHPPWNKNLLIPNMCNNRVNIVWEWGLVSKGNDVAVWNDFMEFRPPPLETKSHLYQICVSTDKHYVGVGSCFKGGGAMFQKQKYVAVLSSMCYINNRVLWQFLRNCFAWNPINSFLFFLTVIYICKELSILIRFSQFCVFSHISKNPVTIYCVSFYNSHTIFKNTYLIFGLIASGLYNQLQIKWYLML